MKARILCMALALLLPIAWLTGCSPDNEKPGDSTSPPAQDGGGTEAPGTDGDTGARAETHDIVIYLLRDDEKVHPVRRTAEGAGVAAAALEALFAGPTADEKASGDTSNIPEGTRLLGVSIDSGVATVDVSGEFASGGGSLSMFTRVAQVVFTATQFDTVDSVLFKMDGEPLDVLGGEGVMLEGPQTRAKWEEQAPEILVETPARGDTATLGEPLTIAGSANVFEARFTVEVTDGDGLILVSQPVQATSGTGTRGTFSLTVTPTGGKPGAGAVIVSYASPKDGTRIVIDEIPVTFE